MRLSGRRSRPTTSKKKNLIAPGIEPGPPLPAAMVYKTENTAVGIRHTTWRPLSAKVGTNFAPTSGGRSVGMVRSRTQATEVSFSVS
jgi:hypothetical protein